MKTDKNEEELQELSVIYDELRRDARNVIHDLNRGIRLYRTFGLLILVITLFPFTFALMYLFYIFVGTATILEFAGFFTAIICILLFVVLGMRALKFYFSLSSKYSKFFEIEKVLEE